MDVTKLAAMINPEVLADMISAKLPNAIRFASLAPLDYTLEGIPGNTVTIPWYKYIGDATDIAEGAAIKYELLTSETRPYTVKKAGIGVKLTDETLLSAYGEPLSEAQKQILMSIANKVDNDVLAELKKTTLTTTGDAFNATLIEKIENTFDDESGATGVLFLNNKDAIKLRANAMNLWERTGDLGDSVLVNGAFGGILGWTIVRSNKLAEGEVLAVKEGAARIYLKRDVQAERERDIDKKLFKLNADQHYVAALYDESKVVKVAVTLVP